MFLKFHITAKYCQCPTSVDIVIVRYGWLLDEFKQPATHYENQKHAKLRVSIEVVFIIRSRIYFFLVQKYL